MSYITFPQFKRLLIQTGYTKGLFVNITEDVFTEDDALYRYVDERDNVVIEYHIDLFYCISIDDSNFFFGETLDEAVVAWEGHVVVEAIEEGHELGAYSSYKELVNHVYDDWFYKLLRTKAHPEMAGYILFTCSDDILELSTYQMVFVPNYGIMDVSGANILVKTESDRLAQIVKAQTGINYMGVEDPYRLDWRGLYKELQYFDSIGE